MSRSRPHHWHGGPVPPTAPVVVGVVPGQPPRVVHEAAALATALGCGLVCAWVDGSRVVIGEQPDGTITTTPLDPDQDDDDRRLRAEKEMSRHLKLVLAQTDVPWLFVYTVGEAAHGLAAIAEQHDARLIAVGARRHGLAGWMTQLIGGSVAGRLVHTQTRPVVVFPPGPRGSG